MQKNKQNLINEIEKKLIKTNMYLSESENKEYKSITQQLEDYQKALGRKDALQEILELAKDMFNI